MLETGRVEAVFQPDVASRYDNFSWTPDGAGFYLLTNRDRKFAALAFSISRRARSAEARGANRL